jgi:hypothetical protein
MTKEERIKIAKEYGLTYERLFEIAFKLHLQIFHLTSDEQAVYDEIGLTKDENALFGYGSLNIELDPKDSSDLVEVLKELEEGNSNINKDN